MRKHGNAMACVGVAILGAGFVVSLVLSSTPYQRPSPNPVASQSGLLEPQAHLSQFESRGEVVGEGWRQATPGYQYSFPGDHAAHSDYRIEWWYYTGNLTTGAGRRLGYQLTFFRTGVTRKPELKSRWAVRDLYMAHFAISDLQGGSFHSFDRINRAGVGWAGADKDSYRVWNEDWEARRDGFAHHLRAVDRDNSIDLTLEPVKPEVIHGAGGVSVKGADPTNATHYYSLTRMKTSGRVVVAGEEDLHPVLDGHHSNVPRGARCLDERDRAHDYVQRRHVRLNEHGHGAARRHDGRQLASDG